MLWTRTKAPPSPSGPPYHLDTQSRMSFRGRQFSLSSVCRQPVQMQSFKEKQPNGDAWHDVHRSPSAAVEHGLEYGLRRKNLK